MGGLASHSPTSNSSIPAVEFRVVKHRDVPQSATTPPKSRQEVERQAWAKAMRLFHPKIKVLVRHLISPSMDCIFSLQKLMTNGRPGSSSTILTNACNICTRNWRMGRLANALGMRSNNGVCMATPRYVIRVLLELHPVYLLSFLLGFHDI